MSNFELMEKIMQQMKDKELAEATKGQCCPLFFKNWPEEVEFVLYKCGSIIFNAMHFGPGQEPEGTVKI